MAKAAETFEQKDRWDEGDEIVAVTDSGVTVQGMVTEVHQDGSVDFMYKTTKRGRDVWEVSTVPAEEYERDQAKKRLEGIDKMKPGKGEDFDDFQERREAEREKAQAQLQRWEEICSVEAEREAEARRSAEAEAQQRVAERAASAEAGGEKEPGREVADRGAGNRAEGGEVAPARGGVTGRSLSEKEASTIIEMMKTTAEPAREIALTPEAWEEEFGPNGAVTTPLGTVKMGEHQYLKLLKHKRENYFGMVKRTLERPDIVLEEYDPKDGAERATKLLFVKTFVKSDGSRYVHFESVTVQRDNMEVSISSHEIQPEAMNKKMQHDNVLHLDNRFLSSEGRLTEPRNEGSDLVPAPNRIPSDGKGSDFAPDKQGAEAKGSSGRRRVGAGSLTV